MEEVQGQIPHGYVLTDSSEKKWIIGSLIGAGDSTEYYEAAAHKETISDYPAFVKVKPHRVKSFTSEIHFYKQHTDSAKIEQWMKSNGIQQDNLGIPRYLGSALNVQVQNIPFDFLILERCGLDLQTLLSQHHNLFPKPTVLKIAYRIVRILKYFHSRGIVHGDIRACNIRMDLNDKSIAYLLPQFHKIDESDRNAVTFWSEDRHCGAATKKGDFESLLYNLIDWSGGILPWKNAPPNEVKNKKIQAFENRERFLEEAFPTCKCENPSKCLAAGKCAVSGELVHKCLQAIAELMDQIAIMKKSKKGKLNYQISERIMKKRLLNMYHVPSSKLEFSIPTIIGDEGPYVPGLKISTDVLANIIAENCSSFDEVNMLDKSADVIDVVSNMMKVYDPDAAKRAIQKAWEENTESLRTKVIVKWCLKGIGPDSDYNTWKGIPTVNQRFPGDPVLQIREKPVRTGEQVIEQQRSALANDEEWHEAYNWLDGWLGLKEVILKAFGPISSEMRLTSSQVQQLRVLREDYDKQELLDRLSQLATVLTGLTSNSADVPKLNRILKRWLSQLAWLEETSRKLGDASLSQVHDVLQASDVLTWLVKELDGTPEKLTISVDPAKLHQQRELYQIFYQGVIENEPKVVKFINEGHNILTSSQNLKSGRAQQLFVEVMQCQWNLLKKSSFEIHNKLQNIDKYWQTQNEFLGWLSKTEDKLKSLKPISLNNVEDALKELDLLTNEARAHTAHITKLEHIFIGVRDSDKDGQVKDEFNAVKERWVKLNADLLKRTQSLEIISELLVSFNNKLNRLQQKIEQCETGLASYNVSGEAAEDSALSDCSKEIRKEILLLQRSYDIVCEEAKNLHSKAREESIDASHLLNEINRVTISVESLNSNVSESTFNIFKQQCVVLVTELEQEEKYNRAILEIKEKKKALKSKIKIRLSNITELEKIVQTVEGLGFPINAEALRQQVELLSQGISRLDTLKNRLQEVLNNEKHSSSVDERMQKSKEKPSEEMGDASSDSDSDGSNDNNCRNNKKTESSKNKRKKHSSISDSDSDSETSSNSFYLQIMSDFDLRSPRPKKSKHSKDLNDYDSKLSLPRNDKSRQDTYSCHSETGIDSDFNSLITLSTEQIRASSLVSKHSDIQPSLFRPNIGSRYLRSPSSNQRSNSPVDRKFDNEKILPESAIKQEIKKEPCEIKESFHGEESCLTPRAIKLEPREINESFHGEESCLTPRAIKLEPREINDSNVKECGRGLPAIKAEPMSP